MTIVYINTMSWTTLLNDDHNPIKNLYINNLDVEGIASIPNYIRDTTDPPTLSTGNIMISNGGREIKDSGVPISLFPTQYQFSTLFIENTYIGPMTDYYIASLLIPTTSLNEITIAVRVTTPISGGPMNIIIYDNTIGNNPIFNQSLPNGTANGVYTLTQAIITPQPISKLLVYTITSVTGAVQPLSTLISYS